MGGTDSDILAMEIPGIGLTCRVWVLAALETHLPLHPVPHVEISQGTQPAVSGSEIQAVCIECHLI